MQTYKITYSDGGAEEVKATNIHDRQDGTWIDFSDGGGLVLRVLAGSVARVERSKS